MTPKIERIARWNDYIVTAEPDDQDGIAIHLNSRILARVDDKGMADVLVETFNKLAELAERLP